MHIKLFHTLEKIGIKYRKRILGLLLYIKDYKILYFCLIYIIINPICITILRNINEIRTIRYISFGVYILFIIFLLCFFYLKKKEMFFHTKESKGDNCCKKNLFTLLIIAFVVILITISKTSSIIIDEKKVEKSTSSFTNGSTKIHAFVSEEVDQKHTYQSIQVSLLQDLSADEYNIDKNDIDILLKSEKFNKFSIGQVCIFEGELVEPENSEDFNYKEYLKNKKIFFIMEYPKLMCEDLAEKREGNVLRNNLIDIKTKLIKLIDGVLNEPQSTLFAGILFGSKRLFRKEFENNIRIAGVSHIVAASGYNITILTIAVNRLFFFLNKKPRIILSLVTIWAFALFSGLSSSIIRACIMSSISLTALLLGRSSTVHISIPLTATIFIFFNPLIIFDTGFLLSISAMFGLVYIQPVLLSIKKSISKKFAFVEDYILPTMSCTISTLPISIMTFKTFSIWSIIANTLILPVIDSTMLIGIIGLSLSKIFNQLSYFFFNIVNIQLKYFEYIVNIIGNLGVGAFEISESLSLAISFFVLLLIFSLAIYLYPIENEQYNYYLRNN